MKYRFTALVLLALPGTAVAFTYSSTVGCPGGTGAHWPARLLPSSWKLNQSGYSKLAFDDVLATLRTGESHWEEPCCSGFRARYDGTTARTAVIDDGENVVYFEETSWDWAVGGDTIAVTPVTIKSNCEIVSADLIFNGVASTFSIDGSRTDLESIATHEFGHWTGLGHSDVPGATMWFSYKEPSTDDRTLEHDDIDGECSLYPVTCTTCTADGDCPIGSNCQSGRCRASFCKVTSDCVAGAVCRNRTCHPGCRGNDECASPQQCVSGICRTDCPICDGCASDDDCGGAPYACMDTGAGSHCTAPCTVTADCDGDSVCASIDTPAGRVGLCVAPDARTADYCPPNYSCKLITGCPGLWNDCPGNCLKGSDRCLSFQGSSHCTCGCQTDADCGTGARCIDRDAGKVCFPDSIDPCLGVTCDPGLVCREGACIDPCAGVTCAPDEVCKAGSCVPVVAPDPCEGIVCGDGAVCSAGKCLPTDPCLGIVCGTGKKCRMGACVTEAPPPVTGGTPRPRRGCSAAGGGEAAGAGLLLMVALLAGRYMVSIFR